MKKALSILLFWTFVVLCSAETIPKFVASAQKDKDSVLFSAGVKSITAPVNGMKRGDNQDYKSLLKGFKADGA
ncbi:hypothetical protein KKI24_17760 [bacterium]|nr:hypothetical protein [bacterium]